jgi:hypothetical protein
MPEYDKRREGRSAVRPPVGMHLEVALQFFPLDKGTVNGPRIGHLALEMGEDLLVQLVGFVALLGRQQRQDPFQLRALVGPEPRFGLAVGNGSEHRLGPILARGGSAQQPQQ